MYIRKTRKNAHTLLLGIFVPSGIILWIEGILFSPMVFTRRSHVGTLLLKKLWVMVWNRGTIFEIIDTKNTH